MRNAAVAFAAIFSLAIAGCSGDGTSKADSGLAIGALAGGILGNAAGRGNGRIASTAIGAVVGGIIGSEIGRSLDREDRRLAQEAELAALERGRSGERIPWRSPRSGYYGEVVPESPFRRSGRDCREYTHRIFISGRPRVMRGIACRNPDGSWENVG
jgi:surface antigen